MSRETRTKGGSHPAPDVPGPPESAGYGNGGGKGFLLDLERCVGCGACVLACRIENDLPEGVSWRRILPFNLPRSPRGPTFHFTLACHHCADPPCARGCPSGALKKGADGVVLLREDLCLGCRYCEMACPFGAPSYDSARSVMTKCHLCVHRQEEGRDPACVAACPTRALRFFRGEDGWPTSFGPPEEVPGFLDPGKARPNLAMAPPRHGVRGERFGALRSRMGREGHSRE